MSTKTESIIEELRYNHAMNRLTDTMVDQISKRHGVDARHLCELNGITYTIKEKEETKALVKALWEVEGKRKALDLISRNSYYEKFKDEKFRDEKLQEGTWMVYTGFEVIGENKIKILYSSGAGDMEFKHNFEVEF
jgi:hypothetical protein